MRNTRGLHSAMLSACCAFLISTPIVAVADPPCHPHWAHVGSPGGLGWVSDLTLWDADGDGPAPARIVAANLPPSFGQHPHPSELAGIALWNGNNWEPLGYDGMRWVDFLGQWDHDNDPQTPQALIAAGRFFGNPSTHVHRIRLWDGSQWSDLGGVFNQPISAIEQWDPDGDGPLAPHLVAGGQFTEIDGSSVNRLAIWDGANWIPIASDTLAFVSSLTTWDFDGPGPLPASLVVGGSFAAAGEEPATGVMAWDGAQWSQIGDGLNAYVNTVGVIDIDGPGPVGEELVAGGGFTASGAAICRRIARWSGAEWIEVGNGSDWAVKRMTGADLDGDGPAPFLLYCSFSNTGWIQTWDGISWTTLDDGPGSTADILATDPDGEGPVETALIACGSFTHIDQRINPAGGMARWDGTSWGAFGVGIEDSLTSRVEALAVWDPDGSGPLEPRAFAGGRFAWSGVFDTRGIAQWTGHQWEPVDAGVTSAGGGSADVSTIVPWPGHAASGAAPKLIVGGTFTVAGTTPASRIAAWDGSTFHALGSGLPSEPHAITTWDPDGDGPLAHFVVANYGTTIRVWDGASWTTFPKPTTSGSGYALAAFDLDGSGPEPDSLIVAGLNLGVGRRWDWSTAAWIPLSAPGPGLPTFSVYRLLVADGDGDGPAPSRMFAIASYSAPSAPTGTGSAVLEWLEGGWQVVSQDENMTTNIASVDVWDPDASGPAAPRLVAVGTFTDHSSSRTGTVAELDGDSWRLLLEVPEPIGNATLLCMAPVQSGAAGFAPGTLLVGGYPYPLPDSDGSHVASLAPCPAVVPHCTGDINNDGATNAADFVILAGNFGASVPANTTGDLNGDGLVNASDFVILAGDFGCDAGQQ